MDIDDIDLERLRNDLIDYFGTATTSFFCAQSDLVNVSSASDIELVNIAIQNNFNLDDYIKTYRR